MQFKLGIPGFVLEKCRVTAGFLKHSLPMGGEPKTQEELGDPLGTSAAMQVRDGGDLDQVLARGYGARFQFSVFPITLDCQVRDDDISDCERKG